MENERTRGRYLVAANHVTFISRPHTSPNDNAATSTADVMQRGSVRRSKTMLKNNPDFTKIHKRKNAFRGMPNAGSGTLSAPKIRIWQCPDEDEQLPGNNDASGLNAQQEQVVKSSGLARVSAIQNSAPERSRASTKEMSMLHGTTKIINRQNSKPGYHHLQHGTRRQLPGDRFARILKGLRIIIGVCLAIKRCALKHTETSVSGMLDELEDSLGDNSVFSRINLDLDKLKESGMTKPVVCVNINTLSLNGPYHNIIMLLYQFSYYYCVSYTRYIMYCNSLCRFALSIP